MKGYSTKSSDWETLYPIGAIYISTNTTNPATFLGGTWEQIKDRFLLCSGSTYSNGSTGGNATHLHSTSNHTLTINEMPQHEHRSMKWGNDTEHYFGVNGATAGTDGWWNFVYTGGGAGASQPNFYTNKVGGSAAHNHGNTGSTSNIPPYIAVTVWKRTA